MESVELDKPNDLLKEFEYFDWLKNGLPVLYRNVECPKCTIVDTQLTQNDPENLIYYCKNHTCDKYHKVFKDDSLRYAIFYMEANQVKKIFDTMTLDEIEKIKMHEKMSCNILEYIINSLFSISGKRDVPTLDNVSNDSFKNPFCKHKQIEKLKCKKYLELLDVVCQYLSHFISEKMFHSMNVSANYDVITVLNNYYQKTNENCCYICLGSYESQLIDSVCNCKTSKVHIGCLIKTVKQLGDTCGVCKKSFNSKIDDRGRTYFPFSNLYWDQLGSHIHIVPSNDIETSLMFATQYLVIDRVCNILENITDEEFINFKNKFKKIPKAAKFYINFKFDNDNHLVMTPYPATNMSIEKYPIEHAKINKLLRERERQIKKVELF